MAKNLKGITIEIDGNTTKLNDALKKVNSTIYTTNSELKALNSALKLDPSNTQLLSQKQEVLKNNIQATTNKLEQLKEAQKQMGAYNSLTEEQKENYRALSIEIAKSENALTSMYKELNNVNSINLENVKTVLKNVGDIAVEVVKKVAQVVTAVSAAVAGIVAAGVKSYAELEQNVGGVETLFKDNADKVIENANKAYETAGISANEYMQNVTSFSASLLQSLGGDTAKAAEVADMALIDMADNANKFGTDMSSIQNAYQGFAKQNYTMLDNLKLGYGGTKTEMERLLADAEKFSGVHYDISNLSDVYNAIHVIQEQLDVTGTTALEASTTISGSMASMKSAFDNFLNGSGSPEQLSKAILTFITNVSKTVSELAPRIISGIITLVDTLLPDVIKILNDMLPMLFKAAQDLLNSLLNLIKHDVKPIADMVVTLLTNLVNFILENLPLILQVGLDIILALVDGISENIDELVPVIIDCVILMTETLIDHLPQLVEAGLKIVVAIAKGIIESLPEIPKIIFKFKDAFINTIKNTDWANLGKNILQGILNGMLNFGNIVKDTIKKVGTKITSSIKSFFGIKSPSKVMRDQVGKFLAQGIGVGFESEMPDVINDVQGALKNLNTKVQASVNPVINPTANSNPLILNIENFNNTRNTDTQLLMEEMEFYRRNSALAKGGV